MPEDQLWKDIKAQAPKSHQLEQKGASQCTSETGQWGGGHTKDWGLTGWGFFFFFVIFFY